MIRSVTVGAILSTAAVSVALYALAYEVQGLEGRLAELNRDLIAERGAIQVLDAEWSYLNQPERLQSLAAKYLDLAPVQPRQIALIGDLPDRREGHSPAPADGVVPRPQEKPGLAPAKRRTPAAAPLLARMEGLE